MKKYLFILGLIALSLASCKKDDPKVENEEEVMTTFIYTLTPANGGGAVELKWKDLDVDGPNAPVITNGKLAKGTVYNGEIKILNETENPAENVTEEIEEEDKDHQFFFSATNDLVSVAYADKDPDGKPIGLATKLTTADRPGTDKLTIILRHEPNKSGANVSSGNIANAGGETDIEVSFNITVE